MKIWLWIIGIVLFIASVVIGALQHSEVQYRVGEYYDNRKNLNNAFIWYHKSGVNGHKLARANLFRALLGVDTETQLELLALKWHLEWQLENRIIDDATIESEWYGGSENIDLFIGVKYFEGVGVKQDKIKGLAWFKLIDTKPGHITVLKDYLGKCIKLAEKKMSSEDIKKSNGYLQKVLNLKSSQYIRDSFF